MKNLPSPSRAERNQARKRAFIPTWPLLGIAILIVAGVVYAAVH